MILQQIIEHKKAEVQNIKNSFDTDAALGLIDSLPPAKPLSGALKKKDRVALLAEIKRASPSRGIISKDFVPAQIAGIYTENGADAISVVTDRQFFSGDPGYIAEVREVTDLPVLRKDFIIDPIQIYQSRLLGSDAVLLICAVLPHSQLCSLLKTVRETGMEALVEVHDENDLDSAVKSGAGIIGINNRDLKTFVTDINTTVRLSPRINRAASIIVSESGIKSGEDVDMLKAVGVDAVLVGEALMAAADISAKVRELSGR